MSSSRNQRSPALALDIGAHSLKLLCLKRDGQALILDGCTLPLSSQDPEAAAVAVREALGKVGQSPSPGLMVSSAVGGPECVAQVVELPPLEDSEIAQAAQFEGRKICPVAGEPLVVAHQLIGRVEEPARVRVLVAAIPQSLFKRHVHVLNEAGLAAHYVEAAPLALANAAAAQLPQTGGLLLDLGHDASNLTVLLADGRFFSRRIEPGGQDFTGALMQHFGIAAPHAEELKHTVGLRAARPGDPREAAEVSRTLQPIADQLILELRRSLTFAETLAGTSHGFTKLALAGGGAMLQGLSDALGRALGIETALLDPLADRNVNWRGGDTPGDRIGYSLAMGLMERWL